MSKDASNGTKSKSNSFSVAITKLFHKSNKDHKGGSTKEKKTDTTDTTIDVHRSRSGSTSKNTPPPVPHETIPTPTIKEDTPAHNGRGSHNDTESNTTGESSHVATDIGIKQDNHQGHTTTTTTPNVIATPDKPTQTTEENRTRPPTPPADITQKQQKSPTVQPATSTSPETPTHHVVDRVKDADLVDSARSSGELLDVHQPSKMKKNRSGFVPLPFEEKPKIDTPNSRQRSSGPPEILPEEITYEESDLVGHGSFGSVYKGRCRGQEVAVKVPKKQKLTMAELTSFRNEVKIMSVIYHPHVVLFLGACTQLGKMQIITERCMTDLEKLLASDRDKKHYTLFHRMQMAKDAALGVNWLHSKCNIVHLDLKSANLLLDHNMRVKVTDFGFSQIKDTLSADKAKKGTPLWMAPEVMMGQRYDEKADVYSFGIILWEILTREIPYAHHNDYQTFFRAVCIDKERPPIPPNTPPSLEHLITSCWDFNPQKRPSFEEIIYRLSEVLVDCCVDSEEAGDLWKKNFLVPKQELTEQVPWPEFEAVVRKSVEKHNVNLDNLRLFLVCPARDPILKGKEVVTMERFDKVIKWFGMFFDPEEGPAIIDEVNELVKKGWFHGDLPKEIAMDRLSKKDEGTFLIRLSSTDPKISPFTLSMTNNQHRRIRRTTVEEDGVKGYNIIGKPTVYNSLVELAEKCMDYNLRFACPKETPGNYNPYDPYREVVLSHSN